MRRVMMTLLGGAAILSPAAAHAADALKFGPPPAWVRAQALPAAKPTSAPVQLLLEDEQVAFERGKVTSYSEGALRIENAQGLSAGNLAIVWQPATDTVTVNKLQIIRDGKVIDVLAGGQTFTVLRRETNLDAATLDGTLTASIQPEGLQQGDVLVLATTTERSDPVLKGHVEAMFGAWGGLPIQSAHASLQWPADVRLNVRETPNLPAARRSASKGMNLLELSGQDVQPVDPPDGAPARFKIGRLAEATDFASWSALADLFMPLFRDASVIPAAGPLHDEVDKIRTASSDPVMRATQALALVQDRVRYVALLMGQGGYVPASADVTWSRRFGDCKAKTALLLGILHSLGIEAEPVLVQSKLGDMVADRLPMIALFNHVLVRAHIGGKDYWLDGTRAGDSDLAAIEVPDFGWGLPLVDHAQLVRMVPRPLDRPNLEQLVTIDASAGVFAKAPITIEEIYRGDSAVALNTLFTSATAAQRDDALHDKAQGYFDDFAVDSSSFQFDKAKRQLAMTIKGAAKLNWKDGWFDVPTSSIAFNPNFDRPAGPLHDVPLAIDHPRYARGKAVIRLPAGFAAAQKLSAPVGETLAGVEYARTESVDGATLTVESSERSIAPEVAYKDAVAAAPRLRALGKDDVYLGLAGDYHGTDADLKALQASKPASAQDYFIRADVLLAHNQQDAALADLDAGLALDPKNSWGLQKRAALNVARQHFVEAEKNLQAAASVDPGDAQIIMLRGQIAMSKGDITGASAAFDEALRRDPKNVGARVGRATILLQQAKVDDSLREITAALSADPQNGTALALRAQVLDYRSDRAGADRDIAAALIADPDNAMVLATKASIAIGRKDYDTATQFVAKALARDPNNGLGRNLQAQLAKREGNGAAAMTSLDEAVATSPNDPNPLINRAMAHVEAKEFDAAGKDASAALAIQPANLRALEVRAEIARRKGDYAGAVEALTSTLAAAPSNGPILMARAEAYRQLHKFDEALADTQAAMNAGLVSPSLRLLRINILVQKGDPAAVAAEADQLVKENPNSDLAFVVAGKTYAAIGLRDKAMASFDRALALQPQAYIYLNRAQVRPHADLEGKIADLDAALKLDPDQEDALAQKAWVLSKAGRQAEAIALYDQAIKGALDPSDLKVSRAVALQRAGRTAEAKAAFAAQRAKAKTAGDYASLCRMQASNDILLESALGDCRHAIRLDPAYPNEQENLAFVLLKLGKLGDALAAFTKAISEKSGADAYMGRAITRARMGDMTAARADSAEAHRLRADIDDTMADIGLEFEESPGAHSPPATTAH